MVKKIHATDIGKGVPKNLKFGIIVAVALFWAEFLKSFFNTFFAHLFFIGSPLFSDFIIALIVTLLGYVVLMSWRKIKRLLEHIDILKEF